MRSWILALVLPAGLTVLPAHAESIYVRGTPDCGRWVENRTANNAVYEQSYLIGILDGLALGKSVDFWRGNGRSTSPEQVWVWMDKHCRDNPMNIVAQGALILLNEMVGTD